MNKQIRKVIGLIVLTLTSCTFHHGLYFHHTSWWRPFDRYKTQHVVVSGDTLYAIAFRYDQDYHQLARKNRMYPPYTVRVGQVIFLKSNVMQNHQSSAKLSSNSIKKSYTNKVKHAQIARWIWPLKGRVQARFLPSQGQKGIDIAGSKSQSIYATQGGVVAYAGTGLPGYGNLIIINHPGHYLTAYGNNSRNLVKEGQAVKAGQIIGIIGIVDNRYWGLHFEVRRFGHPINPLLFLAQ